MGIQYIGELSECPEEGAYGALLFPHFYGPLEGHDRDEFCDFSKTILFKNIREYSKKIGLILKVSTSSINWPKPKK